MNTIKAYWFVFSLLVRTAFPKIPAKKRAEELLENGVKLLLGTITIGLITTVVGAFINSEKVIAIALATVFVSLCTVLLAMIALITNEDRK